MPKPEKENKAVLEMRSELKEATRFVRLLWEQGKRRAEQTRLESATKSNSQSSASAPVREEQTVDLSDVIGRLDSVLAALKDLDKPSTGQDSSGTDDIASKLDAILSAVQKNSQPVTDRTQQAQEAIAPVSLDLSGVNAKIDAVSVAIAGLTTLVISMNNEIKNLEPKEGTLG